MIVPEGQNDKILDNKLDRFLKGFIFKGSRKLFKRESAGHSQI